MTKNREFQAIFFSMLSMIVNIGMHGMHPHVCIDQALRSLHLHMPECSGNFFFENHLDLVRNHYKQVIENFLKHSEFIQKNAVDVAVYFNAQDKNIAASLRNYVGCMQKNIGIFRTAAVLLRADPQNTPAQAMTEEQLLQLVKVLTSDSFRIGYKEFELMTFFDLSYCSKY